MAGGAFDALRPLGELAAVRIGQVAVCTFREGDFFLEITTLVTGAAIHGGMFAEERIFRFRVIEVFVDAHQGDFFPTSSCMACLAGLRETAMVHVGVAVRALAERNSGVSRLAVGP